MSNKIDGDDYLSFADFCADPSNHALRAAPVRTTAVCAPAPDAVEADGAPSVVDSETGRVRVMGSKCWTCVGRPATRLSAERRRELLGRQEDGSYDEGWTVCHSTLDEAEYGLPASVCAWVAEHRPSAERSVIMRLGASTGFEFVDPAATFPPGVQRPAGEARDGISRLG
ncbi:hypothetical protein ACFY4B_27140 [Kitasatospora sp. NPDC001261]|uniref:hypothetical protein n=1 Tax=Kitasatospora sp. NPDC001261 TaxID=3364012 RepID=UPI003675626F